MRLRAVLTTVAVAVAIQTASTSPAQASPSAPTVAEVSAALCVHSGWHFTSRRVRGVAPDYVLWHHGYWHTWHVSSGSGEGSWTGTVGGLYGGGMSFEVGTWNTAAGYSHGRIPRVRSTSDIAAQPPRVQIQAALYVVAHDGDWREWPNTARACGLPT